jgi:PKD repeat protein
VIDVNATATYAWNFGDGNTGTGKITEHIFIAAGTYDVTLTITDTAGCSGSVTHTLTITQPPVAHFYANAYNCEGQTVNFFNMSYSPSGYITQWVWNFGDGNSQTINFPNNPNTSHTYTIAGTYNATLTVTNSNGCSSTFSRFIYVVSTPVPNFIYNGSCAGSPVQFTDITQVTGSQFIIGWLWNFGDPASGINNISIQQNPVHTFGSAGNYTVRMIIFTSSGCSDTIYRTITIDPLPFVDFTTQSTCEDSPVQFTPSASMNLNTIASWFWQFGDGSTSTLPSPSHTYANPGTYVVTLTVSDTTGCSNSVNHTIVISPAPLVNFSFSNPACSESSISFTDLTQVSSGYITQWTWSFGDGNTQTIVFPNLPNTTHTYSGAGNFNITLTVTTNYGCIASHSQVITVNAQPSAAFVYNSGCVGTATAFTDLSTSVGSYITSHLWNFGDPGSGNANTSALVNPTHIYNTAGSYTVTLIVTNANGCSDTTSQVITIDGAPAIDFSVTPGCSGDTTQFVSSTYVNMATTQSWLWHFGDGGTSTLPDPIHIYTQPGNYTVTLTITDITGCQATKSSAVTINPAPIAAFTASTPGCQNTAVTFTDLSNGNGGNITMWHWVFGDGLDTTYTTFAQTITHSYAQAATFSVSLTVYTQNSCEKTYQQNITISPAPVAGFTYQNTCEGDATQFSDQTTATGGITIVAWNWNFGDPASGANNTSTLKNPSHTFTAAGTYQVVLFATNASGCTDSIMIPVVINPEPGVDFFTGPVTCDGSPVEFFTDTTQTNIATVQTYDWDFGDGTPHNNLQNPVHTYANPGTYNVTLTITDISGCDNTITHTVTVTSGPVPAFAYQQACMGTATQFTDLSSPPAGSTIASWHWDFGINGVLSDTSDLQNPEFTYTQAGLYTVTLTVVTENGCSNSISQPVQIWNTPTAAFTYNTTPCTNGTVQFMDQSTAIQATVTSWLWEFEPYQYSTLQHPSYTYYKVDTCYNVKLIITDSHGCSDTIIQQVCVSAAFEVSFTQQNTCAGSAVQFTSQLVAPGNDIINSYQWNFGDPTSGNANNSSTQNPSHVFSQPGFYTVTLTAIDIYGCSATHIQSVEITALPVASFTYEAGECDSTVTFTSTSLGIAAPIVSSTWTFGDGTTQTITAPQNVVTHKYPAIGQYTVILTIIDENGCSHSITENVELGSCLVAAMFVPDTLICQNYTITFSDRSTGGAGINSWQWTWGDGTAPTVYTTYTPSVTHVYTQPGQFWVSLKVTSIVNGNVMSDSTAVRINVLPSPLAGFITDKQCFGDKTAFMDTTNNNGALWVTYNWNFGDPSTLNDISEDRNPTYTYQSVGQYDASLIVTNQFGCKDTATAPVTIHGLPNAAFDYSAACQGKPTYFFDHSEPNISPLTHWGWRIDQTQQIGWMTGSTPSFTFDETGNYIVLLTVTDTNGCVDTVSRNIQVYPTPVSAFGLEKDYENVQGQVHFINGSLNADQYYWDFGNGQTSLAESPVTQFDMDGDYLVQLFAYNQYECMDSTSMLYKLMITGLWVPNAFAPSGPIEQTRLWKPVGINLAYYRVEVYDRWDAMIWSSESLDDKGAPTEGWDGTYKEVPCQQGIYVWKITAIFRDGKIWRNKDIGDHTDMPEQTSGTITLIR